MKLVFLMSSLVGAFGADCHPGSMHMTDAQVKLLTDAKVSNTKGWCSKKEATSKATCDSGCCQPDLTKCGIPGYNGAGLALQCDAGKYGPNTEAYNGKATTVATFKTDCCVAVATCASSYGASAEGTVCPAGKKYKTSSAETKCTGGTKECKALESTCCEPDVLKCGGLTVECASPKTSGGNKMDKAALETWKNKATTEAKKLDDCCVATATCATAGYTCAAGYEKDTTKATTVCAGQTGAAGYYSLAMCPSTCCKKDVKKCGGLMTASTQSSCASTHYYYASSTDEMAAKNKASAEATKTTDCCTTKAKCKAATCGAGMKMKASVAEVDCASDAASCASGTTCCEKDVTKCGGLDSIVCAAGTYNECGGSLSSSANTATKTAWEACLNKAATDATKATACCTAKGKCSDFKTAVSASALVSKTAAQMLPGTFLLVVLSAIGAVW